MKSVVAAFSVENASSSKTSVKNSSEFASWKLMSDGQLIDKYKEGSDYALSLLYVRYYRKAVNYLIAQLKDVDAADEVAQTAFMSVSKAIKEGAYQDKGLFKAYFMRVVCNKLRDHVRSRVVRTMVATDFSDAANVRLTCISDVSVDVAKDREAKLILLERLAKDLPDNLRCVFELRMQDVKFAEISRQLNISINTATSRYQYAVRHLRDMCACAL